MFPRRNWDSPTPFLAGACAPPPWTNGGKAHSPAGDGLGESQFRRLEKKLSTLSTLCSLLNTFKRKGKNPHPEPDPYFWLKDSDPGGSKTFGYFGSGSGSGSPTQKGAIPYLSVSEDSIEKRWRLGQRLPGCGGVVWKGAGAVTVRQVLPLRSEDDTPVRSWILRQSSLDGLHEGLSRKRYKKTKKVPTNISCVYNIYRQTH